MATMRDWICLRKLLSLFISAFKDGHSFNGVWGRSRMLDCLGGKLESFGFESALSGAAAAEFSGLCRCRSNGVH